MNKILKIVVLVAVQFGSVCLSNSIRCCCETKPKTEPRIIHKTDKESDYQMPGIQINRETELIVLSKQIVLNQQRLALKEAEAAYARVEPNQLKTAISG